MNMVWSAGAASLQRDKTPPSTSVRDMKLNMDKFTKIVPNTLRHFIGHHQGLLARVIIVVFSINILGIEWVLRC